MGSIAEFGMGMGLAGAAGIRARYPLLVLGLLVRYSEGAFVWGAFEFLGNSLVILTIAFLVVLDFFAGLTSGESSGYGSLKLAIRGVAGGIVLAAVFSTLSIIWGLILGAVVAISAYLVDQRITPFLRTLDSPVNNKHFHEILAFLATVLILVLPLMGYVLWVILIILLFKNRELQVQENRRYRNFR